MTYLELIRLADHKIDRNIITLAEFDKMIEPLRQEIPSVQPKPKTGKWLGTDDWYHKCSNCGEVFHFYYKDKYKWRYCPYCKTNMEEGE